MADALAEAKAERERRREAGFDQAGLDLAARVGFANGAFEELDEDGNVFIEEFFPEVLNNGSHLENVKAARSRKRLEDRLSAQLEKPGSVIRTR